MKRSLWPEKSVILVLFLYWALSGVALIYFLVPVFPFVIGTIVVSICVVFVAHRIGPYLLFAMPLWVGVLLLATFLAEWDYPRGPGAHPAFLETADIESIPYFFYVSLLFLLVYTLGWWLGARQKVTDAVQKQQYPSVPRLFLLQIILLLVAELPGRLGVSTTEFGFVFVLSFTAYVFIPLSIWIALLLRETFLSFCSALTFQILILALAFLTSWRYLALSLMLGTFLATAGFLCIRKGVSWTRAFVAPILIGGLSLPVIVGVANLMRTARSTGQYKFDSSYSFGSDFLLLGVSTKLYDWINLNGVQWGVSIFDAFRQAFPTFIVGTKQRPEFLTIVDSFGVQGAGMAVTSFAEIYANFGLFIGLGLLFPLGAISGKVQRSLGGSKLGPMELLINVVALLAVMQIFQRGYLFSSLFLITQIVAFTYILRRLSSPVDSQSLFTSVTLK